MPPSQGPSVLLTGSLVMHFPLDCKLPREGTSPTLCTDLSSLRPAEGAAGCLSNE
jgi:hypothetical protein